MFAAIFKRLIGSLEYQIQVKGKKDIINEFFHKNNIRVVFAEDKVLVDIVGNDLKRFYQVRKDLFAKMEEDRPEFIQMWEVNIKHF